MQCRLYYRLPLDQQILVFLQDIDLFCRKHTNITRLALQDWEVIYVDTLPVPVTLLISIPEEILITALGFFVRSQTGRPVSVLFGSRTHDVRIYTPSPAV